MGIRFSNANFNSHAHVERDWEIKNYPHAPFISTHTLTWSVTFKTLGAKRYAYDFNSHAHVERDVYGALFFGDYDHFNSHAHVERDL